MFAKKQHPGLPSQPFAHTDDCGIVRADPDVEIPWSRIEARRWQRICQCGAEGWSEPEPERARRDPLDPATAMHSGECEFREADRDVLRVALKVRDGAGGDDYWWVTCAGCDCSWAVPRYAEESVG